MSSYKTISTAIIGIFLLQSATLYADCEKTIVFMRHGEKNTPAFGQLNCQGENRALALPQVLDADFGKPAAIYACNPAITNSDGCLTPDGCCPYNRPSATINPTGVYFSLPVNTAYGNGSLGGPVCPHLHKVKCHGVPPPTPMLPLPQLPSPPNICGNGTSNGDVDLARELLKQDSYCGKTVFVAWEHTNIPVVVYNLFNILGLNAVNKIPLWPYGPCLTADCHPDDCSQTYNFDTLYVVTINQSSNPPTIKITLGQEGLNGQSTICPT